MTRRVPEARFETAIELIGMTRRVPEARFETAPTGGSGTSGICVCPVELTCGQHF